MVLYPSKPKNLPPTCRSCLYYGSHEKQCYEPRNVYDWDVVEDKPLTLYEPKALRADVLYAIRLEARGIYTVCGREGSWYKSNAEYLASNNTWGETPKQETPAQLLARLKRIKVGDI